MAPKSRPDPLYALHGIYHGIPLRLPTTNPNAGLPSRTNKHFKAQYQGRLLTGEVSLEHWTPPAKQAEVLAKHKASVKQRNQLQSWSTPFNAEATEAKRVKEKAEREKKKQERAKENADKANSQKQHAESQPSGEHRPREKAKDKHKRKARSVTSRKAKGGANLKKAKNG